MDPLESDMQVLVLGEALDPKELDAWLATLGDTVTPLENEDEVHVGAPEPDTRETVLKLLRVHHFPDDAETPQTRASEDAIIESSVTMMLHAAVIEESNGAWGLPVELVKKKDSEVRFCVDYRALNKVTKKDEYPLPRIDETLDAFGGAVLFTTLDLHAGYCRPRWSRRSLQNSFDDKARIVPIYTDAVWVNECSVKLPADDDQRTAGADVDTVFGVPRQYCSLYAWQCTETTGAAGHGTSETVGGRAVTQVKEVRVRGTDHGVLGPVAFASKVNSDAAANYPITELECLAVVWTVKLFRPYLYGRTFEIITDHAAVKWLMTRPNLAGRRSLTLHEYEFEIVYRPGTTNVVADALSQVPDAVLEAVTKTQGRHFGAHAVENLEDEAKSEEDGLPTTEDVRAVAEYARRTAGQPQTVAVPGVLAATTSGTTLTESVVATATGGGKTTYGSVAVADGDRGAPTGEKAPISPADDNNADSNADGDKRRRSAIGGDGTSGRATASPAATHGDRGATTAASRDLGGAPRCSAVDDGGDDLDGHIDDEDDDGDGTEGGDSLNGTRHEDDNEDGGATRTYDGCGDAAVGAD
ncbi:unnamed protein product [Phytophthora fragariaefolia]|uniref:Unnamed protein product n=1 Tax=Phytophthora fragariaefolia TaxID=1490495 RepID=A0A9W6Y778_9STRA|nr:unnamed protein product [Phytophthora fragariaefolia]